MTWMLNAIIIRILNVVLAVIAFFLILRIAFRLFAANPTTPFVSWVYGISSTLLTPFQGIFPNQTIGGSSVFDIVALIGFVGYGLLIYLLSAVIDAVLGPRRYVEDDHHHAI